VNALDETRLVDVLEAIYALDRPDDEWLSRCLLALSHVSGKEHDHAGFFYDASDVADLKVWNWCRLRPTPPELARVWDVFQSAMTPAFVRATFRSLLVGSGRKTDLESVKLIVAERERSGHGDFFYLNALDPSGKGCVLSFSSHDPKFTLQPKDLALLKRIANHLSAAYRCRRRLADTQADSAEAILDTRGRILHAEGAARRQAGQPQLRTAAAAIEMARSASERRKGSQALERWQPLNSARWTLVDRFEEGGRRYVIARENQAEAAAFSAFTDRERQIVVHAALGLTNKEIAYTLGISAATVRVLIARAARRVGLRTRNELLGHAILRDLRPGTNVES
jgi:DNA-binding CsgD family transcriptional regulator